MDPKTKTSIWLSPRFQVTATWVWNFLGAFVVSVVVAAVLPQNIAFDRETMIQQPTLALIPMISEIILVGLLPIIFCVVREDKGVEYGLTGKGLLMSLILSAFIVLIYLGYLSIRAGHLTSSVFLPEVHNLTIQKAFLAALALIVYGPLEIFFVVWLIHNTDRIFKSEDVLWSWGLLLTIAIYGLLHTFSQGLNSFVIAAEMLAFGLVFKRTRNAIGPMIALMFMNEYAWFLAGVLLR